MDSGGESPVSEIQARLVLSVSPLARFLMGIRVLRQRWVAADSGELVVKILRSSAKQQIPPLADPIPVRFSACFPGHLGLLFGQKTAQKNRQRWDQPVVGFT